MGIDQLPEASVITLRLATIRGIRTCITPSTFVVVPMMCRVASKGRKEQGVYKINAQSKSW